MLLKADQLKILNPEGTIRPTKYKKKNNKKKRDEHKETNGKEDT